MAPLEDEIVAAAPVTDEIPELIEIPSAPPSEAHTVMEDDAKLIVVEEAVAVAATAVPDSSVTVGTPEPPAVSSVPFPAPKEKKQGLFDKRKDVIGGDNKASSTSRAPGSTPDPRLVSSTTTNSKPAEEMKLALARAAEPRQSGKNRRSTAPSRLWQRANIVVPQRCSVSSPKMAMRKPKRTSVT